MAKAKQRNLVNIPQTVPNFTSAEEAQQYAQRTTDTLHELNARIFFLQEQIAVLAVATATTVQTLEDY